MIKEVKIRKYYTRHLEEDLFIKMRVYAAKRNIPIEKALNQLLGIAFVNPMVKSVLNKKE